MILLLLFTEWGKAAHLVLTNASLRSNEHDALRPAFLTQRSFGKLKALGEQGGLPMRLVFLKLRLQLRMTMGLECGLR